MEDLIISLPSHQEGRVLIRQTPGHENHCTDCPEELLDAFQTADMCASPQHIACRPLSDWNPRVSARREIILIRYYDSRMFEEPVYLTPSTGHTVDIIQISSNSSRVALIPQIIPRAKIKLG
jgi:hypothetical protein